MATIERSEDNQKQDNEDLLVKFEEKQREMEEYQAQYQHSLNEKDNVIESLKYANQAFSRELSMLKNELECKNYKKY